MKDQPLICRSCGGADLHPVLSLGRLPLANALLTREQLDDVEPTYPLDVVRCQACTLVQITATVPPETLFRQYLYFSSMSATTLRHAEALVNNLVDARRLDGNKLVVEVASNDGYLLQYYQRRGVPVLGIEPAVNIAHYAQETKKVPTRCEFFGAGLAYELASRGQRADVVHAHNVLAHAADLNGVVAGIRALLKDDGIAMIEVPYLKDLLDRRAFDTIYHEHLCYFSLTALVALFQRHELCLFDVEQVCVHGGSLRLSVGHSHAGMPAAAVGRMLADEQRWGVEEAAPYCRFRQAVEERRASIRSTLSDLRGRGARIAAYGAAAKGTVLLNYCEVGGDLLDFVVDRSPHKQGRYVPGVRLPIHPPERLLDAAPDYTLLLAWNMEEEVLAQQSAYRARGGRFIVPIPATRIV